MSRALVGLLCFAALTGACAAPHANQGPLLLEVERLREENRETRLRARELEMRLSGLEQRAAVTTANEEVVQRLDRLIALNAGVLVHVGAEPARELPSTALPADEGELAEYEPRSSAEARLLQIFERMRRDQTAWGGGLSREQREALRILLREERKLDGRNPWH